MSEPVIGKIELSLPAAASSSSVDYAKMANLSQTAIQEAQRSLLTVQQQKCLRGEHEEADAFLAGTLDPVEDEQDSILEAIIDKTVTKVWMQGRDDNEEHRKILYCRHCLGLFVAKPS